MESIAIRVSKNFCLKDRPITVLLTNLFVGSYDELRLREIAGKLVSGAAPSAVCDAYKCQATSFGDDLKLMGLFSGYNMM